MDHWFNKVSKRAPSAEKSSTISQAIPTGVSPDEAESLEWLADTTERSLQDAATAAAVLQEEDPYRARVLLGPDIMYESQNFRLYMDALNAVDSVIVRAGLEEQKTHPLWISRQRIVAAYLKVESLAKQLSAKLHDLNLKISTAPIIVERGVEGRFVTGEQIVRMNEKSSERPQETWDLGPLMDMDLPAFTEHINNEGSGRYFLHAFPEVSIRNGHIADALGGDALLGGFESSRDRGPINFTAEEGTEHATQFYLGLGAGIGGGVLYPAEAILQNYAFINLPYLKNLTSTSSEWRIYGPTDNPASPLHVVPLRLGVCFFASEDETRVRELLAALPENIRPNKVVFHPEGYNAAMREYVRELKKPVGLPRISRSLDIIETIENAPIFGTSKVKREWHEVPIGKERQENVARTEG